MMSNANELLHAQAHLWNILLGFLKSMSLKSAIELGIADVLHKRGEPMSLPELMSALSIPPTRAGSLSQLMRALVHMNVFTTKKAKAGVDGEEEVAYLLTSASRMLVSSEAMALTPFLRLILDPIISQPSHFLAPWFMASETTPFELFHGKRIWDVTEEKPEFNRLFSEGMASDSRLVAEVTLNSCGHVFQGLKSLVDVGGGTGTMARAITEAFPEIKCTVLDLPHVVDTVKKTDVEYVGGDMFVSIPKANAVILKWILHDWSDEECIKILKRCKEAISTQDDEGKVIIIDIVVGATIDERDNAVETQVLFDLLMLVVCTGKERNEWEWRKIFHAAGFTKYKITPLIGLRSIIELYP